MVYLFNLNYAIQHNRIKKSTLQLRDRKKTKQYIGGYNQVHNV